MTPITKAQVTNALKQVNDPELRMNVVDLGLIYEINISEKNDIMVKMTVTTPGCPVIDQFLQQANDVVEGLPEVGNVTIRLTFEPLWTPEKMNPEARDALGL